jgi:hypothetical protein
MLGTLRRRDVDIEADFLGALAGISNCPMVAKEIIGINRKRYI